MHACLYTQVIDEVRYRWNSIDTYRQNVQARVDSSLERFQQRYERASKELRKDVDTQLARATSLQEEYMARIAAQQQRLAELTKSELQNRKEDFNLSLEQFKKNYDDKWEKLYKGTKKLGPMTKAEMKAQQQRLDETFNQVRARWSSRCSMSMMMYFNLPFPFRICPHLQFVSQYRNSSAEVRGYIDRMVRFSSDVFPKLSIEDDNVKGFVKRLREEEKKLLGRLG